MIQIGIIIDKTKQIENLKNIISKINKNKYSVVVFSNLLLTVELPCFATSELIYFDGILFSFNVKNLSQCKFAKQVKKLVYIPLVDKQEPNDIINLMKVKEDDRFVIVFDHSFSKHPDEDRESIFTKTMLYPEKEIKQKEDINKVIGELYDNR